MHFISCLAVQYSQHYFLLLYNIIVSLLIKYFACEALPAGDFQHSCWPFNLAQNALVYPLHLLANIPMLRTEKTILHINLFCQVFFFFKYS